MDEDQIERPRRNAMRVAAAALLSLAVTTACASTPEPGAPTSPTPSSGRWSPAASGPATTGGAEETVAAELDSTLPTPLAAYALTAREMATLAYARRVLVQDCLADFGFSYPVAPYKDILASQLATEKETVGRWFGITDREAARKYGMLLDTAVPDGTGGEELGGPSFELALWGHVTPDGTTDAEDPGQIDGVTIPQGGCDGEASRRLGRDSLMNFGDETRDLMFTSSRDFQSSAGYQALQREWSACMATAGYPDTHRTYNDPYTTTLVAKRTDPDTATGEEIDFALQSIDCMDEVDLQRRALDLRAQFDQQLLEQHQLELQENRRAMDEQVRRATEEIEKLGGFR